MVLTVTLLADHKGYTKPRVNGDEYMVDALIDMDTYAAGGLTVSASSLGLSSITQVMVTGQDSVIAQVVPEVSATGLYATSSTFVLNVIIGTAGASEEGGAVDYGSVRVRVHGLI
tara:strand:- start:487 stop:831 length:345 start_codon:yes stop_codon:yes gene_type:complete